MLDRPRHKEIVEQIRAAGASLRMIGDGDIARGYRAVVPRGGCRSLHGNRCAPEAVLAAAAIKCLGGDMQCRMWPRDEKERKNLIADGYEKIRPHLFSRRSRHGQNIIFLRDRDQ